MVREGICLVDGDREVYGDCGGAYGDLNVKCDVNAMVTVMARMDMLVVLILVMIMMAVIILVILIIVSSRKYNDINYDEVKQ